MSTVGGLLGEPPEYLYYYILVLSGARGLIIILISNDSSQALLLLFNFLILLFDNQQLDGRFLIFIFARQAASTSNIKGYCMKKTENTPFTSLTTLPVH